LGHAPGPLTRSRGSLILDGRPSLLDRSGGNVDCAELLQSFTLLLLIDDINNSWGLWSGRVTDRPRLTSWSAGRGTDLVGASAWGALLFGRSAQAVDGVPAWSVGTEGSERGRLCVALAGRPLAAGVAIRVVSSGRLGRSGASGGELFTTKRPGSAGASSGSFSTSIRRSKRPRSREARPRHGIRANSPARSGSISPRYAGRRRPGPRPSPQVARDWTQTRHRRARAVTGHDHVVAVS
jgi:hypothetical protein